MALQRGQGHHVLIVQPPQGSPWHSMFIFSVRHQPYAEKLEHVLLKAVSDCQIKRGIQARTETFNGLTTSGGILVLNKNCKKITAEISILYRFPCVTCGFGTRWFHYQEDMGLWAFQKTLWTQPGLSSSWIWRRKGTEKVFLSHSFPYLQGFQEGNSLSPECTYVISRSGPQTQIASLEHPSESDSGPGVSKRLVRKVFSCA